MIQDLDSHESGDAIETDIVVVGSGPAGLSLAMRLAEHGLDVTILESGGTRYSAEAQDLNAGFDSRGRAAYLQASRIRVFGGTSFHWGGWCRPLDAEDFRSRAWIDYSGWPLTAGELAPHYAAASKICDLDRDYFDLERWVGERGQPALAWSDDRFHTSFFQLSPPTRFGKKYEDPVEKSNRIRVLLNATVSAVNLNESGGAVERLTVTRNDGSTVVLRARRYVLACGGIENARLLLLSNDVAKDGVGNDRGLVGRFFMDHMGFSSGSIIPERSDLNLGLYVYDSHPDFRGFATIVPSVGLEESLKAARYNIELFPQFSGTSGYRDKLKGEYWELAGSYRRGKVFSEFGANMARLWGMASNGSSYLWGKAFGGGQSLERIDLRFHAETTPNPASRVTLDGSARDRLGQPRARLDWQISNNDVAGWHRTLESLAQACGASGIGRLQVEYDPVAGPDSLSFVSGYHHIGTTRMDVDPARGVVDGDCRVHGVENLYVAGSSVFPTAGHANPTLTIVALALRLADHLKDSS